MHGEEVRVSEFPRISIEDLRLEERVKTSHSPNQSVWNLNLDKIEPDSGRIIEKQIIELAALGPSTYPFETGTVLYSKLRPYLNKVLVADSDGYATTELVPLRCNPEKVTPDYLAYFLRSPEFLNFASNVVAGAKMPRMVMSEFWRYKVPVPPLPEQRRIAAILDQAEQLRAQRRAALAKLDSLAQSIFMEMFGDTEQMGWSMATIEDVADPNGGSIRTGPFGSQLLHSEFTESGIAVLGIDNAVSNEFRWAERRFISEEKYQQLKRYTVKPGDVLITIMGTCGRCAVVPDGIPKAINTKHLCCITVDRTKCLPEFLHAYFLRHPIARKHLQQTAKGAIMDGLNMGLIKSMPIPLPSMNLQQEFLLRMNSIKKQKNLCCDSVNNLDTLFSSLQHHAFRGEL